jgi:hypothetical protein
MNVAAGVLLIIAAVFNIMAGCTYAVGGAVAGAAGDFGSELQKEMEAADPTLADTEFADNADTAKAVGAGLAFWGFALFGIAGLMIGGAVCSFMKKKKGFVLATGVLAIIAEVVGIGLTAFGISNVVGLVAGVFVFLAIRSFPSPAAATA